MSLNTDVAYKDLYEAELKKRAEAEKDRDELVQKYNALVDQYNAFKAAVAELPIKILGDFARQATLMGHHARSFDKLEVDREEKKEG